MFGIETFDLKLGSKLTEMSVARGVLPIARVNCLIERLLEHPGVVELNDSPVVGTRKFCFRLCPTLEILLGNFEYWLKVDRTRPRVWLKFLVI